MGIDLFFTGLMLICLDGQSNCPVGQDYPNTAWVMKADGSRVCGWDDSTKTTLELQFSKDHFKDPKDEQWFKDLKCSDDKGKIACTLVADKICVYPMPDPEEQRLETSLKWLPRIDEVDLRFGALFPERVFDRYYVPTGIHFPTGVIGAGEKWPPASAGAGRPRLWFRSNLSAGGALPRELSDRMRVAYERAEKLVFTLCDGKPWIVLTLLKPEIRGEATLRNRGDGLSPDTVNRFDNLSYLLWYYRLGLWSTTYGSCPEYTVDNKNAVLLRCARVGATPCACYTYNCERDSIFWPPVLF